MYLLCTLQITYIGMYMYAITICRYVSMFRTDTHTVTVICMYTQTVHALRNTQYNTGHKV